MAAESSFASLSCFVSIFFTNWLNFTNTIIPVALNMASESIAYSAFSLLVYWLRAHSGSRNNIIVKYSWEWWNRFFFWSKEIIHSYRQLWLEPWTSDLNSKAITSKAPVPLLVEGALIWFAWGFTIGHGFLASIFLTSYSILDKLILQGC